MPDVPAFQPGRARHEQLSDWLREQITSGRYSPHDQLPSEHELGAMFDVSRITVRRALGTLEHEGRIYRRQGLGSFVAPPAVPQGLVRLTDFAQDMARAGMTPSSRILHHGPEEAAPAVAGALGITPGSTVVRLDRLRLGDGEPIALDRTWLPPFYAQLLDGHDLNRETIYSILERQYDIPILRGHYRIEATIARDEESALLEVPSHAPLILVERTSLTMADRTVYFQRRYYRSDRVAFDLELTRPSSARTGDTADAGSTMSLREFEPHFKTPEKD